MKPILRLFLIFLLIFISQKVAFLYINASYAEFLDLDDCLDVLVHGLRLDIVATSYLMVVPILIFTAAIYFPRLNCRTVLAFWYALAALLVTMAFVADTMLYRYWGAKLDAADFFYAQHPRELLASFTFGTIALTIVVILALAAGKVQWMRHVTPEHPEPPRNRIFRTIVMALLLGLDFIGIRGGVGASTANPGYACFSQQSFLNHAALNPLFNIAHSMCKDRDLADQFQVYDDQQLAALTQDCYTSGPDVSCHLLRRQPQYVVMVVWEGGGDLMLSDPEVAPCFGRLRTQGVSFDNCYANSFRTDRALVSLLSGWPALPTASIMTMGGRCTGLPSLARSLGAEGYSSAFYYGGDIDFTNMRGYLYATGCQAVEGDDFMSDVPHEANWGVHDEYLLRLSAKQWPAAPAFVTYLTLSSHEPWDVPYHRLDEERVNAFAYTDSCIGAFVAELRRQPLWDSLLLIIVPDHGVTCHSYRGSDIEVAKIPMLWLGGAVARPARIGKLMNQSDIAATLLAQMGIAAEDYPFSRNIFSSRYKPMAVHTFKNGLNLVTPRGSSQFECLNGRLIPSGSKPDTASLPKAQALLQLYYSTTAQL